MIEVLKLMTKGTNAVLHEMTLLRAEVRDLRVANEILSGRRREKKTSTQ